MLACDPPRSYTTEWTANGEAATLLTITVAPEEGGARLDLVHEGVQHAYYVAGWAACLSMLTDFLADPSHDDLGGRGLNARAASPARAYEPVAHAAGLGE